MQPVLTQRAAADGAELRMGSLPLSAYIFAGIFLLRLVVLVRLTESPFLLPAQGDMHFYDHWAQRIQHGELTDHRAFYGLPLYPYLLAALYKLFGYSPFIPGLLQIAADAGTGVLIYKIASRTFRKNASQAGEYIGALAAAGWAFYLPAQAYSVILMPTALAVFVFWFVVWEIVRRDKSPKPIAVLLLGALVGFSAMGIATVLFVIPLLLAAVFFKWKRPRTTLPLLLGVGLGLAPCAAHNYFVAHDRVLLSAHSGINFWIGNNPYATGYPRIPPGLHAGQEAMLQDSIDVVENNAGHEVKRSEVSDFWAAKARAYIRENPGAWLKLVGAKVVNFWNSFQYDDLSIIANLRLQGVLLPGLKFGFIAAVALAGMAFSLTSVPAAGWTCGAVLLHMVSLLTVFVTERYRMAAVPGLLIFAAFAVVALWRYCAKANYRRVAAFAAVLVLTTAFVSLPKTDPSLRALDLYNTGWQALESKDYPLAKEKLELAYAYVPGNAEINFALGNLHLAQGDKSGAKSFYADTIKRDPTHASAWNNLAVLALDEERWELAIKFLRQAARISRKDAKVHYLLARAYASAGDREQAEGEIDIALRMQPAQPEFTQFRASLEQQP